MKTDISKDWIFEILDKTNEYAKCLITDHFKRHELEPQSKTPEERADEAYTYLLSKGVMDDMSAEKQIAIQDGLRIASGKYEPQSKNDVPTLDIKKDVMKYFKKYFKAYYMNENDQEVKSLIRLIKHHIKCKSIQSEHIDISEPMKEGKEADIFKKALSYYGVDNFVTEDGLVFKAVLKAMQEYRNQAIIFPDRDEVFQVIAKHFKDLNSIGGAYFGFDKTISEIKRLNNIK